MEDGIYTFEIEKFLSQMVDNPYISELKTLIKEDKRTRLSSYLGVDLVDTLSESMIDYILRNFKTSDSLHLLAERVRSFDSDDSSKFRSINIDFLDGLIETASTMTEDFSTRGDLTIYTRAMPQRIENKINKLTVIKESSSTDTTFDSIQEKPEIEFKPTELTISTITIIASLNKNYLHSTPEEELINVVKLYEGFEAPTEIFIENTGVLPVFKHGIENIIIGCHLEDRPVKGYFEKDVKKNFYNSITLNVLYKSIKDDEIQGRSIDQTKCINVKVFINGTLQITGCPTIQSGKKVIQIIHEYLEKHSADVVKYPENLELSKFETVMINTDYVLGFPINRDSLYHILTNNYDISAHYDADGYPGVKIWYMWNEDYVETEYEGHCRCKGRCNGKGKGNGEGDCKKVTIAVFQSGKVIITGGNNLKQIKNAYNFINQIMYENYLDIRCNTYIPKAVSSRRSQSTNTYSFSSKSVVNMDDYERALELINPLA
jgi:TATA-box binding protein (TBP) (component of TFIID and TFIIIB)